MTSSASLPVLETSIQKLEISKTTEPLKHSPVKDSNGSNGKPRLTGIESETALDKHLKPPNNRISAALEKRQKHYQSAPRTFTYEKVDMRAVKKLLGGSAPNVTSSRPRSPPPGEGQGQQQRVVRRHSSETGKAPMVSPPVQPNREPAIGDIPISIEADDPISVPVIIRKTQSEHSERVFRLRVAQSGKDQIPRSGDDRKVASFHSTRKNRFGETSVGDIEAAKTGSQHQSKSGTISESVPTVTVMQDRYVSTSYQGSLDEVGSKATPKITTQDKRLSVLDEEDGASRHESGAGDSFVNTPTTTALSPDSDFSGGPNSFYDDIQFIQYTSQDLQLDMRKKTAKIVGRYVMGDILGEGSYGKVKEGFCIETLKRVAIKIMKQSRLKKIPNGEANVKREIALLKQLRHKNIIELMDVITNSEKHKIYVIFEYCASTLSDLLARAPDGKFPLSQAQRYFKQLVKGLKYLHGKSIIHRDIKPGNLLLTVDDTIKITDFGVAEQISRYAPSDRMTSSSGSPAFQPPEVAAGKASFSAFKVDVWATGVTLYHFICGKYPFDGENIYTLFDHIAQCRYVMPPEADEILASLISGILEKEPEKRASLDEISSHPWLLLDIPRHPKEIPVIPPPGVRGYPEMEPISETITEETTPTLPPTLNRLSNPSYAYDTTLIPYLESMFDDLPVRYRRSSAVEELMHEKQERTRRRREMANKFLRRLSLSRPANSPTSPVVSSPISAPAKKDKEFNRTGSSMSHSAKSKGSSSSFVSRDGDRTCRLQ